MTNIQQEYSTQEPQTTPGSPPSQAYQSPSPVYPGGGSGSGPNPAVGIPSTPPGLFTPVAGQMCINNGFDWAHQTGIDHSIFWVPWDHLITNSTGTPAFNPDNICTLTAPVGAITSNSFLAPPGAGTPGNHFPGIVIPADGYYYLYQEINVFYTIAGPVTDQICSAIFTWDALGGTRQFLDSDTQVTLTNTEPPQESQALRVAGAAFLTAGSTVFSRLANTSGVDLNGNLLLDEFSWFGAFRIR